MELIDMLFSEAIFGGGSENSGGAPGSTENGLRVVDVPTSNSGALGLYPCYDLSDSLGVTIFLVDEIAPTGADLEGSTLFYTLISSANDSCYREKNIQYGDDSSQVCLYDMEELPGCVTLRRYGTVMMMSLNTDAAGMLSELIGAEIPPGLYVTSDGLLGSAGACLIYTPK